LEQFPAPFWLRNFFHFQCFQNKWPQCFYISATAALIFSEGERVRILNNLQPLGLVGMRIALGAVMIVHGYPKVTGIHGVEKFFGSVGLPWWSAYFSAGAEFFGGILIMIGLLTRFFGLALLIDMIVAIDKVHWKHGFVGEGNYQLPLTLAALSLALIFFGAGPIALDAIISRGRGGRGQNSAAASR
jgi:putative oxidoreductase